ncbi:hypothetical protein Taro_018475 [Colocasia esculenta]|uniref:Uncharacterized protein n=1 Tax=Colocasia esculenta TaxID=4460 RepID=A0A843UWB0_COLES|nr:hypothetical protein [Colocasia esculenta]
MIRMAREAPIWNRHFDPVDNKLDSEIFGPAHKFLTGSVVAGCRCDRIRTPLCSNGNNFPLGIEIAYVTTIRNRHSETVDKMLVSKNSVSGPKFRRRAYRPVRPQFGIDTLNRSTQGQIQRFPVRHPNSSSGAWSLTADAIMYKHPFTQTGITFRSVIGIAYKTLIQNPHPEALVAPLLPQTIRHHFGVEKPSFHTLKLRF